MVISNYCDNLYNYLFVVTKIEVVVEVENEGYLPISILEAKISIAGKEVEELMFSKPIPIGVSVIEISNLSQAFLQVLTNSGLCL